MTRYLVGTITWGIFGGFFLLVLLSLIFSGETAGSITVGIIVAICAFGTFFNLIFYKKILKPKSKLQNDLLNTEGAVKMAKELCPICGQAVKGVFKTHIKDKQAICKDCASKMNLEGTMIPLMSADDVKKHLEYREENKRILDGLQPTQKANAGALKILADMNKNYWYLDKTDKNGNYPVFRFDEIAEFHLDEDGETVTKGGIGGAVVGGILAGGVGAIVGSNAAARKSKTEVTSMTVHISLSNPYFTHFDFQLIPMGASYKKGSLVYSGIKQQATTLISLFDSMCKKVETERQNTFSQQLTQPQGTSTADEILKYKNLLDCGAITSEEFEAKKKQLLGL